MVPIQKALHTRLMVFKDSILMLSASKKNTVKWMSYLLHLLLNKLGYRTGHSGANTRTAARHS